MPLATRAPRPMPRLRLSAQEAESLTLISRRLLDCTVPREAGSPAHAAWRVSLTPGRHDAVRAACDREVWIDWSGARLHLRFPARAAALWLAARLGVDEADALDPPLADAVLEAMLDEVVERLALGGLGTPRWRHGQAGQQRADPSAALAHAFVLAVRCDAPPDGVPRGGVLACVETDAFGVLLLASLLARQPEVENDIALDALPVPLRLVIGDATLPAGELASLDVGDIVRCAHCSLDAAPWVAATAPDGQVWRLGRDTAADAAGDVRSRTAGRWIFLGRGNGVANDPSHHQVDAHVDDAPFGAAGDDDFPDAAHEPQRGDAWVERLPVRLEFDLGTQVVPLGELRRLQPGQAIDLARPLRAPVRIRANGMAIGWGELVDIDGHAGVVIVALAEETARDAAPRADASSGRP